MRVDMDDLRALLARLHREAEADRVGLRHVGAHDQDAVASCRSSWNVVAAPRPNEVLRLGTEALCHIRAWFSMATIPSVLKSFLIR